MPTKRKLRLYALGSNSNGQLGIGTRDDVAKPTEVPKFGKKDKWYLQMDKVAAGSGHTAIKLAGEDVWLSGSNKSGQLGHIMCRKKVNVRNADEKILVEFEKAYKNVTFVACTSESTAYIFNPNTFSNPSAVTTIFTEGLGDHGELGRGGITTTNIGTQNPMNPKTNQWDPMGLNKFTLPDRVIDFAAGTWHYVAVLENGEVWGWGLSRHGQLGIQTELHIYEPVKIATIPFKATKVACGRTFTFVLGNRDSGECALLSTNKHDAELRHTLPNKVPEWQDVGATWNHIFVLFQDGTLQGWGLEKHWKLIPKNLPFIRKIAVGTDHILALTPIQLISWGWGYHGNCGDLRRLKKDNPKAVLAHDYISGSWTRISDFKGAVLEIGAGWCTSFILTEEVIPGVGEPFCDPDDDTESDAEKGEDCPSST